MSEPRAEEEGSYAAAVTDETPRAPAGWYPNPFVRGQQRYWDGTRWTEHNAPLDPPPPPVPRQPRQRRERFRFTRRWVIALVVIAVLGVGIVSWSVIDNRARERRVDRCIDARFAREGIPKNAPFLGLRYPRAKVIISDCEDLYP